MRFARRNRQFGFGQAGIEGALSALEVRHQRPVFDPFDLFHGPAQRIGIGHLRHRLLGCTKAPISTTLTPESMTGIGVAVFLLHGQKRRFVLQAVT